MAKPAFYQVLESFITALDGVETEFHKGEVVTADEPALRKFPQLFGELVLREKRAPTVEQATSAPGEQRGQPGKAITTTRIKGRDK